MERNLRSSKKICSIKVEDKGKEKEDHLTNHKQTIGVLNDDCLLRIFEYLSISDRIRLERVNKHWLAVSRMSWKSFKTLNFTSRLWGTQAVITRKAMKDVLLLCGEYLKIWDMSEISVIISLYPEYLLQFCRNLTCIDFTSINVDVKLIKAVIKYCKNIVILNLGTITIGVLRWFTNGTIFSTYENLQVLNIELVKPWYMSVAGNWIKFKNNDSIKELHLTCFYNLYTTNLTSVVPELTNLHTLSLTRNSLFGHNRLEDLGFIELSNIQVLDISNNEYVVNDGFLIKNASAFARLKSLNVGHNWRVTDDGLRAVISLSKLEYLDIDFTYVRGSSLSDLPYLKELSCRQCPRLEVEHMQFFFDHSDRLEFIDLRENTNERQYSIVRAAKKSTDSRTNGIKLHMYVDGEISLFVDGLNMTLEH